MASPVPTRHKKAVRILRFTVRALEVAIVVLAILGIYTLLSAFSSAISDGEKFLHLDQVSDPDSGEWRLILKGQPSNGGLLDITVSVRVKLMNIANETVAEGENSTSVPPSGNGAFTVMLGLSREEYEQYGFAQNRGIMELELNVRTLLDLVGFSIRTRIRGGE